VPPNSSSLSLSIASGSETALACVPARARGARRISSVEGADRVEQFLDVVIEEQFLVSQVLACCRPCIVWLSVPPLLIHPRLRKVVASLLAPIGRLPFA
jgi:hypothetical protein